METLKVIPILAKTDASQVRIELKSVSRVIYIFYMCVLYFLKLINGC